MSKEARDTTKLETLETLKQISQIMSTITKNDLRNEQWLKFLRASKGFLEQSITTLTLLLDGKEKKVSKIGEKI